VQARDDYGVTRVVLHVRLEDLETGREKGQASRIFPLGQPRAEVPRLPLARLTEFGATVGDRLVFWAETEDGYDLAPETGPQRARTPAYRVAVVAEEQLFAEIRYRDDWSAQWYDSLKLATLARREQAPPRLAPDAEPAAQVAQVLLHALPSAEQVPGEDGRAVQGYFESLGLED
jgi:hypothetical protein